MHKSTWNSNQARQAEAYARSLVHPAKLVFRRFDGVFSKPRNLFRGAVSHCSPSKGALLLLCHFLFKHWPDAGRRGWPRWPFFLLWPWFPLLSRGCNHAGTSDSGGKLDYHVRRRRRAGRDRDDAEGQYPDPQPDRVL